MVTSICSCVCLSPPPPPPPPPPAGVAVDPLLLVSSRDEAARVFDPPNAIFFFQPPDLPWVVDCTLTLAGDGVEIVLLKLQE